MEAALAEPEPRGDPAALRSSYESLREAVLAGCPEGFRHGQGLLATRGMAAWITTWAALAPADAGTTAAEPSDPPSSQSHSSTEVPNPSVLSSLPNAGAVVGVLAQMALAHV